MDAPELSILVVSYNTRDLTLACLASIYAQTRALEFEVLVVDNASEDGSAEAIAREFPQARLLAPGDNLGFGRANNLAAREARGQALLLLNPDTEVLDGAVQKIHRFGVGLGADAVVGGRTFFADGTLNPGSCWGETTVWSLFCMATGLNRLFPGSGLFNPHALGDWQRDSVRDVGIVAGCLMWLPRSLWDALGGFDPDFFMYAEDADLCMRARDLGARCLICPEAGVVHHAGASETVRADKMVRLFRARAQLMRKHWSRARARLGVATLDLWAVLRLLAFGVGRPFHPRVRDGFRTWSRIWAERRAWSSAPAGSGS